MDYFKPKSVEIEQLRRRKKELVKEMEKNKEAISIMKTKVATNMMNVAKINNKLKELKEPIKERR